MSHLTSREHHDRMIGALRWVARKHGYALAVHGTLARDIDLVAVPWTSSACDPVFLAMALRDVAAELNKGVALLLDAERADNPDYFYDGCPGAKPHGRLCWAWHLGGGPYIDLSVFPPRHEAHS